MDTSGAKYKSLWWTIHRGRHIVGCSATRCAGHPVEHQQISATRNAGAEKHTSDVLFFVDADTLVSPQVVQSALRRIGDGAVGGGCVPHLRKASALVEGWRIPFSCSVSRCSASWAAPACSALGAPSSGRRFLVRLTTQRRMQCLFGTQASRALRRTGGTSDHVRRNLRAHSFWSIARCSSAWRFVPERLPRPPGPGFMVSPAAERGTMTLDVARWTSTFNFQVQTTKRHQSAQDRRCAAVPFRFPDLKVAS